MLTLPDFEQKKIILAFLGKGDKLSFKNDNIIVSNEGVVQHQSSCYRLFAVILVGHCSITTGILQRAKKFGFSIFLMSLGMTPYGCWLAKTEGNVALRKKQYSYDGTEIAQRLVADKIDHQIRTLSRRRGKSLKLKKAIVQLKGYRGKLPDRKLGLRNILGLEGIASRIYFRNLFDEMRWVRRSPRTKFDITNLLLDIGYTQLFNIVDALLSLYGFDTYQGVYHKTFYQRKSLVCDLVEPFRPLIDYQIRKGYTLGKIQESDFDFLNKQYRIFGKAAAPYLAWTLKPILDNQTEIFLYIQRYYRAFMQDKPIGEFPYFSVKG